MELDDLVYELKKNMPQNLNEKEIARYIYIELGKLKSFNEKFYFGDQNVRENIYAKASLNKDDVGVNEEKLICIELSKLYRNVLNKLYKDKEILKQCNITVKVTEPRKPLGHVFNLIKFNDGTQIQADLTHDIYNIQSGFETEYFGTMKANEIYRNNIGIIPRKELEEMDIKIGYITKEEPYSNYILQEIKAETNGQMTLEKLDNILKNRKTLNFLENKNFRETYKTVYKILNECYLGDKNAKGIIYITSCSGKNNNYTVCVQAESENNIKTYLLNRKMNKFINVSEMELIKLKKDGVQFGVKEKEPGAYEIKEYIKQLEDKYKEDEYLK